MSNYLEGLRTEMEQQSINLNTAYRVVPFDLGEYPNKQKGYSQGTYVPFKSPRRCKFFFLELSESNMAFYRKCASLSEKVKSPCLLTPKLVEKTLDNKFVVIGFEFDYLYEEDPNRNLRRTYLEKGALLEKWWLVAIKDFLVSLKSMHDQNVFHGNLDKINSYVIYDGRLCFVMPTKNERDGDVESFKEKDLSGFKKFLNENAHGYSDREWQSFLNMFTLARTHEHVAQDITQLIKHPVLMDSDRRFDYLRAWMDYCRVQWTRSDLAREEFMRLAASNLQGFTDWDKPIEDRKETLPVYHAVYKYRTYTNTTKSFLRYLDNLVKHISGEGGQQSKSSTERELAKMYPGLLCDLHVICVRSKNESYASFASESW